jgi:hypothetical protein
MTEQQPEAPAIPGEPLTLPADEFDLVKALTHAMAALADDNEGVRLWMLDCGELVAKHRARAEAAEATLAGVRTKAGEWAALAPADDWGESMGDTAIADCGRAILAITGSEEESALARRLVAQAEAADDGYKVAATRAALHEFLHQYGRSTLPTFKVAVDLAVSLRKIVDDPGSEEESRA